MKNYKTKGKFRKFAGLFLIVALLIPCFADHINVSAASEQRLDITNLSMSVGQTQMLKVSNADEVTWSSSKKSVATVSSKGLVRAKKAGRTTITATVDGKKLKCYVVVNQPSEKEKDILIAFFSQTETTTEIARQIRDLTGGDLMRIRPQVQYTSNYNNLVQVAQKELQENARPAITTAAKNIDSYDVIYIGYPIWWGNAPMVVYTFLEQYDLAGKTIIPFCTSGGSSIEGSLSDLKQSCAGASLKKGYTAETGSKEEVQKWLEEIGELDAKSDHTSENTETGSENNSQKTDAGKLLVAYFSWSGTSEQIANNIIEQTGADSFRIERETPYSTDYTETAYGDAKEEADNNARPPINNPLASVALYDKIIICYPIWWHTAPMTVGTFLESYDLTGKTIYPISQSASMDRSQYMQSVEFIKNCAKGAVVDDGIFTRDNTAIQNYIDKIINNE